jgi:hypothetical protein
MHIPAPGLPGFAIPRLCSLMRLAVSSTGLDLSGLNVLTEGASGAYVATAVAAAIANARQVHAVVRPSRYGSVPEVREWTLKVAAAAGVADRISVVENVPPDILVNIDIVTNSGHLRPITSALIDRLPPRAVIALMFEAWEFRGEDIDAEACRRRRIPIVAVNERHPTVDVFAHLGALCVRLLQEAGFAVCSNRIALLCDNAFAEPIARGLSGVGALVDLFPAVEHLPKASWDAVVVALRPTSAPRIGEGQAARLAECAPGATIAQLWGDIDRDSVVSQGLSVWPRLPPKAGHMAVLLSDIGPEPIVRLQVGGLRAAEWVRRGGSIDPDGIAQLVDG